MADLLQTTENLMIRIFHLAEVPAKPVLIEFFLRLSIPESAGVRRNLIGQNNLLDRRSDLADFGPCTSPKLRASPFVPRTGLCRHPEPRTCPAKLKFEVNKPNPLLQKKGLQHSVDPLGIPVNHLQVLPRSQTKGNRMVIVHRRVAKVIIFIGQFVDRFTKGRPLLNSEALRHAARHHIANNNLKRNNPGSSTELVPGSRFFDKVRIHPVLLQQLENQRSNSIVHLALTGNTPLFFTVKSRSIILIMNQHPLLISGFKQLFCLPLIQHIIHSNTSRFCGSFINFSARSWRSFCNCLSKFIVFVFCSSSRFVFGSGPDSSPDSGPDSGAGSSPDSGPGSGACSSPCSGAKVSPRACRSPFEPPAEPPTKPPAEPPIASICTASNPAL